MPNDHLTDLASSGPLSPFLYPSQVEAEENYNRSERLYWLHGAIVQAGPAEDTKEKVRRTRHYKRFGRVRDIVGFYIVWMCVSN